MTKKLLLLFTAFLFCFIAFGQIGFEEHIVISKGFYTTMYDAYVVDLDNDGDLDILSASFDGIAWQENLDGQEVYSELKIISTGGNSRGVFASDIDGDGDMDVLSASISDDKISWYENLNGLGDFGSQIIISESADSARSVYSGDIDGDGDMDVISHSFTDNKIAWYKNLNGLGDFGTEIIITSQSADTKYIRTGDLDSDGDIDVLAMLTNGGVYWYENTDGLGNYSVEHFITSYENVDNQIHIFDFDNDGDLDLLKSNLQNIISIYENTDGAGNFGSPQNIINESSDVNFLFSDDLDDDGLNDIIISTTTGVRWNKNLGNGFSNNSIEINESPGYTTKVSLFLGDLDSDNDIDIVTFNANSQFNETPLVLNMNINGLGNFGSSTYAISRFRGQTSVHLADLDGDNKLDILAASNVSDIVTWYRNVGVQNTLFTKEEYLSVTSDAANFVNTADIDGDGDLDILSSANGSNEIAWYNNLGNQDGFSKNIISSVSSALGASSVSGFDMDNDNDLDVVFSSNVGLKWYKNLDGLGNFLTAPIIINNENSGDVAVGDLDNDGLIDLVETTYPDGLRWYKNLNDSGNPGDFSPKIVINSNAGHTELFLGDLDGDNDIDILAIQVVSTYNHIVSWYENIDGLGNFGVEHTIDSGENFLSVHASDIDMDGDLDVLSSSSGNNQILLYENLNGTGSFGIGQVIASNLGSVTDIYAGDIDSDGDIDILAGTPIYQYNDSLVWLENIGSTGNEINGIVQFDLDANNSCSDLSDITVSDIMIIAEEGSNSYSTFSVSNGLYQLFTGEGNLTTSLSSQIPNYYISNPISQNSTFTGVGNTDTINFCIEPIGTINDLNISVYPSVNTPRPGFDTTYQIVYKNVGTTQLSGDVTFQFDDTKLSLLNVSETIASQTSSTITFDYVDLNPFETRTIGLEFNVFAPPTTEIGDVLVSTATVNPVTGDNTPDNNVFNLNQTVIGSYDPNDIRVLEGDEIVLADTGKYLHYIIRFQNTGTASAINVRVNNVLDNKLDWTTMQLESLSHTGRVEITNGSDVDFIFDNINLPDSTTDEPNSHGFIAYKIKPKDNVVVGDTFFNTADIFFDFNPAIVTNTVSTTIVSTLSTEEFTNTTFLMYPNPANNVLTIKGKTNFDVIKLIDINGRVLRTIKDSKSILEIDISTLSQGLYFVEINYGNKRQTQKLIKE